MCTLTIQARAKVAKQDIISYKLMDVYGENNQICSTYRFYEYSTNELYETKLTYQKCSPCHFEYLDNKEHEYFFNGSEVKPEFKGKLKSVEQGFHSSIKIERLSRLLNYGSGMTKIFKCIIPKGAKIVYGSEGLIVSDKIIITPETVKP